MAPNGNGFDSAIGALGYAIGSTTSKTVRGMDVEVSITAEIGGTGMHPTWVSVEWMRGLNSHTAPIVFQTFLVRPQ